MGTKGRSSIFKIDNGLLEREDGVQLMKPISKLERLLAEACEKGIFGTKMRSVIMEPNQAGIAKVVQQQFEVAKQICTAGLVPIIEPEVDIHSQGRYDSENILLQEISKLLPSLGENDFVMLKLSIPVEDNLYKYLAKDPRVVRVVALSGGYSLIEACEHLRRNSSLIASFSRALTEGLSAKQSDTDFDKALADNIERIYQASIT